MNRIVCLVADGFGVGAAPDADKYGDAGSNTLAHTAAAVGGLRLPNLERLGLGNLGDFPGIAKVPNPLALVGRMAEKSEGKDTTTGHWEIAGLVTQVLSRFSRMDFRPSFWIISFEAREFQAFWPTGRRVVPRSSPNLGKRAFGREGPSSILPEILFFRWRPTRRLLAWNVSTVSAKSRVS